MQKKNERVDNIKNESFIEEQSLLKISEDKSNFFNYNRKAISCLKSNLLQIHLFHNGIILMTKDTFAIVDYNNIIKLDFMFCKAKLSLDMNANEPLLNDEGIIEFKKASESFPLTMTSPMCETSKIPTEFLTVLCSSIIDEY